MERDDDSKKELIEGLKKAAQGNSRNKTARLREIFDEVEAAKKSGLSLKAIVGVLADRGLIFDLATFVNVRHRIKKERAVSTVAKPTFNNPPKIAQITTTEPERENINTESKFHIERLLPDGSVNPEYLNLMRKKSKEEK